jgi:uncharacterized protein YndB with AHSA1/START domain
MVRFKAEVVIKRPIEDVFAFVARAENAPRWNSAVRQVKKLSEGPIGVGSEYWMSRQLPRGPVENTFQVVEYEPIRKYAIQTTSGPTPFLYRYEFERQGDGTRMVLSAEGELGGAAAWFSPIASAFVKRGAEANLKTLKDILESRS